jgi:hypothetical protein
MKSLLYSLPIAFAAVTAPMLAQADISFVVSVAPPVLPVYAPPPIPGEGYIWTPGYWAWNNDYGGYYWVSGAWVLAPYVGALWTPGYWATSGGQYRWHSGYWGTRIGYYGGVNYGGGYSGVGYQGGYWDRGGFRYNHAVHNSFGYTGGFGGMPAQPVRPVQLARQPEQYAPQFAMTVPREVTHPQPTQNPWQSVRPALQVPVQHVAPGPAPTHGTAPSFQAQAALPAQPHQNAPRPEHWNGRENAREFRER